MIAPARATDQAGRLTLAASFDGRRTVVDTLRQEGLSRCSRPFEEPGGASRVVTSQFGPGFVRGDRFIVHGSVGPDARLIVTAQSAARAVGAGATSHSASRWTVGSGAELRLLGEPLVMYDGARHESETTIDLEHRASVAVADVTLARGDLARVASRLRIVDDGGAVLVHDAWTLEGGARSEAVGTGFYVSRECTNDRAVALAKRAQRILDAAPAHGRPALRGAVDVTACAGVAIRLLGDTRDVHTLLLTILAELGPATNT